MNEILLVSRPSGPAGSAARNGSGRARKSAGSAAGNSAGHDELAGRGVEFTQPPAERPYRIEAVLRDDPGNRFSFTQRAY